MTENTAVNTGNADDVVQFLSAQHEQIRSLLDDVLASTGEERQRGFDDVRELLARHETAEEMIVRPLTRKASQGDEVADARMAEENEAKKVLANLEKMDVDSTEFTTDFTAFRQSVRAHAEAEETLEFPILRETSDPKALEKARSAVQAAERMAPTHPHPSAKTTTMNYVAGPFAAMLDRARDAFSKASS
jgi:hemerythrin superfamily protein